MKVDAASVSLLFGDMRRLDQALESRSQSCHPLWILADGLVSTLRGIAQVIFVNNPVSGALILIGLFCSNVFTGVAAIVSVIAALLCSRLFDQPQDALRAGLTSFSACLVGTVTVELVPALYHRPVTGTLFFWIILMSALSVLVGCGLGNILGKFQLPAFTLPFNTVTAILFLCLHPPEATEVAAAPANVTTDTVLWDQVLLGSVYSMGQVYAAYTLAGSALIYLGCLLCSPVLTAASYVGALTGTLLGVAFSDPPYDSVYSGVWGYNGILAAEAIMFFMVPSVRSVLLALLNAVLATMIQAALAVSLKQVNLPVFTFPFVTSTLLLLATTTAGSGLTRVKNLRYPELHFRERPQKMRPDDESSATPDLDRD
ncbi:urea transporter 1-like isoform X1 [Amphibalanus amphitrite]|uniref:urea transporter 1-like isoform X1 n=1 Tax=Amphibalanus amphitrite TaxID=1232801 RepID=UPI001C91AD06|nr:urea transporter 1-like isoform X1 [Amphibalanus amphitrite]